MLTTARIVVLSLALVAAGGATLSFGIMHVRRELPVEARAATAARSTVGAAALAVPHRSPDTGDEFTPVFDIARIEPAGDAVIAGRAAPGAIVELLRDGKVHDRAVADRSGQFVMVPPRLPPGDYGLTLRSRQPDGKEATSKQSVAVALQPSLRDQTVVAPVALDKASAVLSKLVAHPAAGGKGRGEPIGHPAASSIGRLSRALQMESYPKFHNEVGVSIVRSGCREFKCIGDKPPQDHPHIYLTVGDTGELLICPYCSTLCRSPAGARRGLIPSTANLRRFPVLGRGARAKSSGNSDRWF